jgi:CheY-like chemotaxis protein
MAETVLGITETERIDFQAMPTVLVIDDDEAVRQVIGVMLENEGFRAVLAADGKTGLQEAFSSRPSLISVDLRMPGLSGVDVCKGIRAAGLRTPLIVLSAVGDEMVLLLEMVADDYFVETVRHAGIAGPHPGAAAQKQSRDQPGDLVFRCGS